MTCIMGKSGIGKSTLLSILMGLEKADEGTVSGMEHQKISAIFQENRLFENLDEPLQGLDAETKEKVATVIKTQTAGKTVLFVTHDEKEAEFFEAECMELV